MASSTTHLDTISSTQAQKEVTANALYDAASHATAWGRRASTTSALTWGYYGGTEWEAGSLTVRANGTLTLTNNATNYIEKAPGAAPSVNTSAFTAGSKRLYTVVTSGGVVTSYTDHRTISFGASIDALARLTSAADKLPYFTGSGTAALLTLDTDGTLAANSDTTLASQKAVKTYVDTAVTGLLDFKGATDCSANPNYPAASKGDFYIVSVAGKIGGASGTTVEAGDGYYATADNAGGTEASVGTSWAHVEHNVILGTIATQNANAVAITGGAIDGTIIGGTTPAAGTFTTLTSTGNSTLGDAEATDTHAIKGATTILSNSASAALTVTNTGSGNSFVVEDSASTDSTPFVITATGAVVIGHTALIAGSITPKIQFVAASPADASLGLYNFNTSSSGAAFEFGQSNNATIGSHTIVASGDNLGVMRFSGSDGTDFIRGAQIVAAVDGTPGTNDMPGRLVFSTTADGASSPTERMRIDSAGSIGIGGAVTSTAYSMQLARNITGGTVGLGIHQSGVIQSDVTAQTRYYNTYISTAAAAFTLNSLYHYDATQATIGAGSTVTNQFGFTADSSLTGATNNYGFYSNIAAGAGRKNFYANGTADNHFTGATTFGDTLGYGTTSGVGGTVTQATSKSTGVTLNKSVGQITMNNAALADATTVSFTVTNSKVAVGDRIFATHDSAGTAGAYDVRVNAIAAGSFNISVRNESGGGLSEAIVIGFTLIKGTIS